MKAWRNLSLVFPVAAVLLSGCDSLWDAEMNVSPDYYSVGVGVGVPVYGYYPGPPAIDPNMWGPVWGGWNGPGGYIPVAPPVGVRPGGNSYNPGIRPNVPVGNLRPGYSRPSIGVMETPAREPEPLSSSPANERGRH